MHLNLERKKKTKFKFIILYCNTMNVLVYMKKNQVSVCVYMKKLQASFGSSLVTSIVGHHY